MSTLIKYGTTRYGIGPYVKRFEFEPESDPTTDWTDREDSSAENWIKRPDTQPEDWISYGTN
jgi:hypothetical protein